MWRRILVVILMAAGLAAGTGNLWIVEHDILAREVNAHRINAGLQPLTETTDLTDYATEHSWAMARAGGLWHSNIHRVPGPWESVGEIVGRGSTPSMVVEAFMASPEHRAVLLGDWTEIGYGHIRSGQVFVTVSFRK